jgi:hypothetical protein
MLINSSICEITQIIPFETTPHMMQKIADALELEAFYSTDDDVWWLMDGGGEGGFIFTRSMFLELATIFLEM